MSSNLVILSIDSCEIPVNFIVQSKWQCRQLVVLCSDPSASVWKPEDAFVSSPESLALGPPRLLTLTSLLVRG